MAIIIFMNSTHFYLITVLLLLNTEMKCVLYKKCEIFEYIDVFKTSIGLGRYFAIDAHS